MKAQLQKLFARENKIRAEADEKLLTQRDVARACQISEPAFYRVFRNEATRIDLHTAERLCQFFRCSMGDLYLVEPPTEVD